MNWKKAAIEDLQRYNGLKASLMNIPERIESLTCKKNSVQGVQTDKIQTSGGSGNYDGFLVDSMVEIKRLEYLLAANKILVDLIEKGLDDLHDKERKVLEKFYINRYYGYIDDLMQELCIEQSQVYRLKDRALEKFVCFMYGIEDY